MPGGSLPNLGTLVKTAYPLSIVGFSQMSGHNIKRNVASAPHLSVASSTGGRKGGGLSIRANLLSQGVTSEKAIRGHTDFILSTLRVNPRLDITKYRVNANYPNKVPGIMG